MGFFDFVVDISSAAVKTCLTPVAIVADVAVKVTTGENPGLTNGCVQGIQKDINDAVDDILP